MVLLSYVPARLLVCGNLHTSSPRFHISVILTRGSVSDEEEERKKKDREGDSGMGWRRRGWRCVCVCYPARSSLQAENNRSASLTETDEESGGRSGRTPCSGTPSNLPRYTPSPHSDRPLSPARRFRFPFHTFLMWCFPLKLRVFGGSSDEVDGA